MKIIDRYLVQHFAGPFLVGVAAFVGILLGIGEIYKAVQLVVREGLPLLLVLESFFLRMPNVIALTMPMATVFAALMASGELSSHGEVVAMRVGGISVWRLSAPIVIAGCAVSIVAFTFNESVGPACNRRATAIIQRYVRDHKNLDRPLTLQLPEDGPARLLVYADKLSVRDQGMSNVTIVELKGNRPPDTYFAQRAKWQGEQWVLLNVEHKFHRLDSKGEYHEVQVREDELEYDIGKTPEQMRRGRKRRPEDLSLSELLVQSNKAAMPAGTRTLGKNWPLVFRQHYHIRVAAPWAALCFAVLGFPLGMRPQRTSTGMGFGLSLAIVFVYYIVFNVLKAFGEQGAMSPFLAAWVPNAVVLAVGLGLTIDVSR